MDKTKFERCKLLMSQIEDLKYQIGIWMNRSLINGLSKEETEKVSTLVVSLITVKVAGLEAELALL